MRKPTQQDAQLLLQLYEMRRDPELRTARAWVLSRPPLAWEEVKARYLSHEEQDRYVRMVSSYWQMVGTLVNRGLLHAEIFFEHTGEDVVTWEKCKQWIEGARRDIRPTYCAEFEQLVKDHLAYRARQLERHRRQVERAAKAREATPVSAGRVARAPGRAAAGTRAGSRGESHTPARAARKAR